MATKKPDAVERVSNKEIVPAWIQQGDLRGSEHLTPEDVRIPRFSIAQALSPQITEGDPSFIEGLKNGDAFNDLTGEIYGRGPHKVVFIRADKPRWLEFDDDRNIKDFNVKAGDPRTEFRDDPVTGKRLPPIATMFYDYVLVLNDEPMAMSFKSGGIGEARRLNGLIRVKPCPIFACFYELTSMQQKNDQGAWYQFTVKPAGFVDQDTYKKVERLFEQFKKKEVAFETTPQSADPDAPDAEKTPGDM